MIGILDLLACGSLQIASRIFCLMPQEAALSAGRFLGNLVFYFSGRRSVAYADLKAAFGSLHTEKQRWQILRRHYQHLGQMFVEVLRFPKMDLAMIKKMVHFPFEDMQQTLQNSGGIFLTAHFGNWEIVQAVPPRIFGVPLHVLARSQKFPRLNAFLNSLRETLGTVVTARGIEIRDLLRSLKRKEWAAVLGDQDAGKEAGIILPFLGRKTTVPTGPFDLAARTGKMVMPTMVVSKDSGHEMHLGKPIYCRPQTHEDIEKGARAYLSMLEEFIKKYPEQWLWETKRWKYSWTKRLLILSDGKPGHVKQSLNLAQQIQSLETQYGRSGMEYPTQTIEVRFKSPAHRHLFNFFAVFFIPFAQGRLCFLKSFLEPQSAKAIEEASADFVISAGSSLVPLNLCMAKDSRAKSLVLMKPGFPFHFFHYDLAVIPAHDQGLMPEETFRTLLTLSPVEPGALEQDARKLQPFLRDLSRLRYSIFLGGDTRRFKMKQADIRKFFETLMRADAAHDFLVTTSRRTSHAIEDYLKTHVRPARHCQMLVIANEDSRPEVAGGMMQLAEILIVTEDSISMISEAVRSGKKVLVLCFDSKSLPTKHRRFREILARESAVITASVEDFEMKLQKLESWAACHKMQQETQALKKRLQEIL